MAPLKLDLAAISAHIRVFKISFHRVSGSPLLPKSSRIVIMLYSTWNEGCGNNNIHLFTLFGKEGHFCLNKFLGHLSCVTSNSFPCFSNVNLKGFGPKRFELLQSCWPASKVERMSQTLPDQIFAKAGFTSGRNAPHLYCKRLLWRF